MQKQILIDKIKRVLEKQPCRLAYLYGSFATGRVRRGRDVDIAVVLKPNSKKSDYQIAADIRTQLGKDLPEIDVREISLNSDIVFLRNVLKPAMPILVKDEKERIKFETEAYRKFYDTNHLREIDYSYIKKRLKENSYGTGIPHYQKTN